MKVSPLNIPEVISNFVCTADVDSSKPYGSGHINDSFYLKNKIEEQPGYLLQRINHQIFSNVPGLMNNMLLVTSHLKKKILESGNTDPEKAVMTLIPAVDGQYYYQDSGGDFWRMFYFLEHTRSYDLVTSAKQAYEGGKAFGRFQAMLSDLPPGKLFEVIPDFHNIQKRLQHLNAAVAADSCGRLAEVKAELDLVMHYEKPMQFFQQPEQQANLQVRVTHNDTKFNNVLLNEQDEAQCVIDLETVMDGYVAYDFGDAIRTTINTREEDEAELDSIQLNMPLFEAYTAGYLEEAGVFLTKAEIGSLMKGVLLLPYMQGVRFLTDYLNGDTYFKTHFAGHNLQRARAQFRLLQLLDARKADLEAIIQSGVKTLKTVI
jgi:hypothetical protein